MSNQEFNPKNQQPVDTGSHPDPAHPTNLNEQFKAPARLPEYHQRGDEAPVQSKLDPRNLDQQKEKKGVPLWVKVTGGIAVLAAGVGIGVAASQKGSSNPEATRTTASGPAVPGQTNPNPSQGSTSPEVSPSTPDFEAVFNLPHEQQAETIESYTPEQLRQAFSITDAASPEDYAKKFTERQIALYNAGCSPTKLKEYETDLGGYMGYMQNHFTPAAEALYGPGYNKKQFEINKFNFANSCDNQATVKQSEPSANYYYEDLKVVPGSLVKEDSASGWSFTFETERTSTLTENDLAADNQYLNSPAGFHGAEVSKWSFTNVKKNEAGNYIPEKFNGESVTN